jgi:hypothetical protein
MTPEPDAHGWLSPADRFSVSSVPSVFKKFRSSRRSPKKVGQ